MDSVGRSDSLEDILETVEEPISVVILSHQYLVLLIDFMLSMKITGRKKVTDDDIKIIGRISFPDKIKLLHKMNLLENKKNLERELLEINKVRNEFAHKVFLEKAKDFLKEYLTKKYMENFKKKAMRCYTELYGIYVPIYEELVGKQ